ncbi:MAG: MATE family efflux transporter [Kiritimatiellae bacterium]|nr:MATE family efflux transporter [Kiritimatiellia bacterium]
MEGDFRESKRAGYLDVLKIVWPLALGMVNHAAMQFADRAFLARYSMSSLEAILPASTLSWIFMSFFHSITGYSGVFVSQYHGAGDTANIYRSYRVGMMIAAISGLLMFPLIPAGNYIFELTAASNDILSLETSYYTIVMLGGFFVFGQMAVSAFFTGRGKTRIVFWVSLVGNLINIAIDPILIFGWWGVPELGMKGAAWATVIALFLQFATLAFLAHREYRKECSTPPSYEGMGRLALRVLRFGIPAGAYEVLNMASFTTFVFVTGRVGEVAFAASNACFTINYLLYAPMAGFAIGAQTLVGHACGRGDPEGARKALVKTLHLALGFVVVACLMVLLAYKPILSLFAPDDLTKHAEFISAGFSLLLLMAAWMLFDSTDTVVSGALKGAGDTKFVMIWMFVASFVIWMPVVFLVAKFHNTMPALWATMVGYVLVIMSGTLIRWRRGRWAKINVLDRQQ